MSTVEGKKQEKRRALLDAAYELFLERGTAKTSVEDITSRAKVAKGTFYLYFQDKGAVMQALLGRVSYQLLNNACEAVERQTGLETFPDKMVAVIDHIIEALRRDTVVLKFLERNFVWPALPCGELLQHCLLIGYGIALTLLVIIFAKVITAQSFVCWVC